MDKKIIIVVVAILILAFFAYTSFEKPQIVGGDKDVHGCIGSAGYSWCEAKQKCLRVWEENCTITKACTEEAKLCPDGSAVGRIGPDCEFAPCPA